MANLSSIVYYLAAICVHIAASEKFASHVTVNTPTRSYSHGVGDPVGAIERRMYQYRTSPRSIPPRIPLNSRIRGYPRVRPYVPFNVEDVAFRGNSISTQHHISETPIPVLPVSPYKIDSPDPESLWPEGLFLPPRFSFEQRSNDEVQTGNNPLLTNNDGRWITKDAVLLDPFLLEGSEAIAAVIRSKKHGIYWFHDIPHIHSLLANQETRINNNLEPNKIGSIRHTWPFNRP